MAKLLHVTILSPRKILFDGTALAVSSKNSAGNFDILAEHANLITLVVNHPIIILTEKKEKLNFKFPVAIIYNSANTVRIYTEITI